MSIDTSDFVEAEQTLKFPEEKQQAKFELGVALLIHKWEALSIAVANSWGGPESADKRDWIAAIVAELFEAKIVDIQLIEETMLYAMQDEFDTQVEDDSALPIAHQILLMYRDIASNNYSKLDTLYEKWQSKTDTVQQVVVTEDPNNPDDSESEDEQVVEEKEDTEMTDSNEPVVDEEGFTLVSRKGRQ